MKFLSIKIHQNIKNMFQRKTQKLTKPSKKPPLILKGVLKKHAGGFGFFIPDDKSQADVYIPRDKIGSALSNDRVEVQIQTPRRRGQKPSRSGRVCSVLKRNKEFILGVLETKNQQSFLKSHSLGLNAKLPLKNPQNIPLKEGEHIRARMVTTKNGFLAEASEGLGFLSRKAKDDMKWVMAERGICAKFPKTILKEIEKLPLKVSPQEISEREDLRNKSFVTIDGQTAQDFDDAIFVEKKQNLFRLYVAIADVSHYVPLDSVLDKEAFERSNSSYFPGFCAPMLPEKLSNDLCSLRANQDRLVVIQEMDFNQQAKRIKSRTYPAVIHSRKRLTYKQAQAILDNNSGLKGDFVDSLQVAGQLAKILLNRHLQDLSFDFNIPETQIQLNKQGDPIDISPSERLFSHQMIEQFMLSANKAVARFLEKNKIPLIYRIHENPDPEKLQVLQKFAESLGFGKKLNSRQNLIQFLSRYKNHKLSAFIHKLTLRAFSQARYSAQNKGHFGLNFTCYTHFTSPIRRYCDLLIHYLIKQALSANPRPLFLKKQLEDRAVWISQKEQNSVQAERQILDIKKARFLEKRIGEVFTGCISSICSFGVFVALNPFDVEGLVRFKDLAGFWDPDPFQLSAVNKKTGARIRLGDTVKVLIAKTDSLAGKIDLQILEHKNKPLKTKQIKTKP